KVSALQITHRLVMVVRARVSHFGQETQNRALRDARQARRGAHRAALDQSGDDRDALLKWQTIHGEPIIPNRFSMSSRKEGTDAEMVVLAAGACGAVAGAVRSTRPVAPFCSPLTDTKNLGGRLLSLLGPTGASGLLGDLTAFRRRHGFKASLAANLAAL